MNILRALVLQHLDPACFKLKEQEIRYWLTELPMLREQICGAMQHEMLGTVENSLVARHIKQVQYDCLYLRDVLYKYLVKPGFPIALYTASAECLEQLLDHIETRYTGFFKMPKDVQDFGKVENSRIRVLLSVDALVYFFKLLNLAGGLDSGPVTQLILWISRNFITPGIGDNYISPNSLTTKYK